MDVSRLNRNCLGWSALTLVVFAALDWQAPGASAAGTSKYAHSDSDKRFLHHIDLYDRNNRKISPESTEPYSVEKTCGRCHDFETISHGWHFNAFASEVERQRVKAGSEADAAKNAGEAPAKLESANHSDAEAAHAESETARSDGRPGEPWIWTDARTGTQLPLAYRDWEGRFSPSEIGITTHEMTQKFGARIPGGGAAASWDTKAAELADESSEPTRWPLTGSLEIDCMACHAKSGAYDFERRRETIEDENFAWAPTAAIRIGDVSGSVSRMKAGVDLDDEKVQAKLPKVEYDDRRFGIDGTVFFDLVRKPENNSCYQCHSQRTVSDAGIDARWNHDQDVHLRAGMNCVDCHRNGIDHQTVRGFEGEQHPAGVAATTLSCRGCHMGVSESTDAHADELDDELSLTQIAFRAGRLGSPFPKHEGLPPVHFEKLSCTACHSGPVPGEEAVGLMTSLAHGLGEKGHRSGMELPSIQGPVFAKADSNGLVTPHRAMWPAYWGELVDGKVTPLPPEEVYTNTRRALRVRKDFIEELSDKGREEFDEKVAAALAAIEKTMEVEQAVYVSTGLVFSRGEEEGSLVEVAVENQEAIEMVRWPMAHNVRPAGWALGATGCLECHSDDGLIFTSTITPKGPAPVTADPINMASIQGLDEATRLEWNQLFGGRKMFKVLTAASLIVLLLAAVGSCLPTIRSRME
ncbi:multiheme c-type cytochrome [Rhodopirellula bahusiensis]|uniref:Cytochrome C n=1 Tax=Rhodopirellula bahusiensis TaxID=2014065 RepID=A0A2G1W746_9BACT|nr:multiheme c-type cytochrome [Rhodopirellula bahusiensis]PHQ34865.1 hypothetical protein CEE69_13445 [Rhodopirellula bahusiensis]